MVRSLSCHKFYFVPHWHGDKQNKIAVTVFKKPIFHITVQLFLVLIHRVALNESKTNLDGLLTKSLTKEASIFTVGLKCIVVHVFLIL